MKYRTLDIDAALLLDIFSGEVIVHGQRVRCDGIPMGARVARGKYLSERGSVRLYVEHDAFEDVPLGVEPDYINVVCTRIEEENAG